MSIFIKQPLIIHALLLLRFGGSLTIKCVSVNNQLCMVRQSLFDLNPDELHYYLFIISIDRYNGSFNANQEPCGGIFVSKK